MMYKIYYLKTCNTCQRILRELTFLDKFELHEIKSVPLNNQDLAVLQRLSGSYKTLFNKRARLLQKMRKEDRPATENDYKELLLSHYTYLKRPIIVVNEKIFVGNHKNTIADAQKEMNKAFA